MLHPGGTPGRVRTDDNLLKRQLLYPLSYGCSVFKCSTPPGIRTLNLVIKSHLLYR